MRVFWPTYGIGRDTGYLVGWRRGDALVVVGVLGSILGSSSSVPAVEVLGKVLPLAKTEHQCTDGVLLIWVNKSCIPLATSQKASFILYTPPDTSRLRFLATSRASEETARSKLQVEAAKQDGYSACRVTEGGDDISAVLPLINDARKAQQRLEPSDPGLVGRFNVRALEASGPSGRRNVLSSALLMVVETATADVKLGGLYLGSIRRHSATVDQICLRLEQLATIPERFSETRLDPEIDVSIRSVKYMAFWNSIWLILNDLILGYCAYEFFYQMPTVLSTYLPIVFRTYLVDHILSVLRFFNDWPIGLKLNTPLSQFLCTTLSLIIQTWSNIITPHLTSSGPKLVFLLSFSSAGGLGLVLAILQDLLSFLSLHLRICAIATSAMCNWQLSSLRGLWNVFRGKRWNVLRQRTDSYAYDVDQLFLGTLLFAVSIFLLPTVLTYSALFAATRLALSGIDSTLGLIVNALNAFPLFELMLRVKEPSRLPAGITFDLKTVKRADTLPALAYPIHHVLQLRNAPRSFNDILRPSG